MIGMLPIPYALVPRRVMLGSERALSNSGRA